MSKAETGAAPFLVVNGKHVHFTEDWGTGIGGGLWSTGMAMATYFAAHHATVRRCLKGRTSALELGSGNGFLSVCLLAALAGSDPPPLKELIVTDVADHLSLIEKTFRSNQHIVGQLDGTGDCVTSRRVLITEHLWGEFGSCRACDGGQIAMLPKNKRFDFIFGSDLAYRDELHDPLIRSLTQHSHEGTVALIGVTMNDTKPIFFDSLNSAGFRYERLADHLMAEEYRGHEFGIFAVQRKRTEDENSLSPPHKIAVQ